MSFSPTICDQCRRPSVDQIGLSIARFDRLTPDQFGFCSQACFVLFVRSNYIENARPAVAPASSIGAASPRTEGGASGTTGRVPSAGASPAVPPSNETAGQGSHPCPAVGGPARPQKQV